MNRNEINSSWLILILFGLFAVNVQAQTFAEKEMVVKNVFDNLVNAYGNAKASPKLTLLPANQKEKVVAMYSNSPVPSIRVDEQLYDICQTIQADSLNALATILSHELAHYYNDHTFCSDYAFATRNRELLKSTKESKIEKETKADRDGIYYAMIAGYRPLQSFETVLNKIYKSYQLPVNLSGYPSLTERIKMIDYQTEEVKDLEAVYNAGLTLLYLNELPEAADCFNYLSMYFPSREVYNNLGVTTFLQAVQIMPVNGVDFIYPIDIDPVSRLYTANTRSAGSTKEPKELLKYAKRYFEKAQSLDPQYFPGYINLACVNTALANYDMALGVLNEAGDLKNKSEEQILHLKAIIRARQNKTDEALDLFEKIDSKDSLASYNFHLLKTTQESNHNFLKLDNYKRGWIGMLQEENQITTDCDPTFKTLTFSKVVKLNDDLIVRRNEDGNINIQLEEKNINTIISFRENKLAKGIRVINKSKGCLYLLNKTIAYEVARK